MPISCSVGKARYKTNIQYYYCLFLLLPFFLVVVHSMQALFKKIAIYLFIWFSGSQLQHLGSLIFVLACVNLWLWHVNSQWWHVGSSSLTRVQTRSPLLRKFGVLATDPLREVPM